MIAFGIWLFVDSSENLQLGVSAVGDLGVQKGAVCGLVLLLAYLFFDSFTGQYQTRMFIRDKSINPLAMMLMINAFSTLFSFITLVHTEVRKQQHFEIVALRSEEHTSELQSLMRISYAVFCLKKKNKY